MIPPRAPFTAATAALAIAACIALGACGEGHEGGGPDPGTEEFEAAQGNAGGQNAGAGSGGTSAGGGNGGAGGPAADSGGQSPPESFEQYCEQSPQACE